MENARWDRIQALFLAAVELSSSEQFSYLQVASAGDDELVASVVAMLQADAESSSLLDAPLPDLAHAVLTPPPSLFSGAEFGPYRIKDVLGEGGMGVVYLAEREDIGSLVAIKILRDAFLSSARRGRFANEQRTLAQLDHPLIVPILDAGSLPDGTPWFVMPYVEGIPLTDYCRSNDCSASDCLILLRAVCEAVQYAHRHAIVHRDLKPSNILVKKNGEIRLLDFGIAKRLENESPTDLTVTAQRPMTLAYAAPEQIRGEPLGTQVDVYALGVVLYELLASQLPFDLSRLGPNEAEQAILTREPESPSLIVRRLSQNAGRTRGVWQAGKAAWNELDVLCLTAMHRDPQRRYGSIEALVRDIDHYLRGEPLDARPDSVRYRLGKFIGRNLRSVAVTAAAAAIALALTTYFVVRLSRARTAQLTEAIRAQRIERFMLNLFDGGDKSAGPADDLRVVTLLDRGARNAATLKAEPAVQAELYRTLGSIYQKQGKFDQADSLLQSALQQLRSVAPQSPDVAETLIALGLLRLDEGRAEDAERLVREGLNLDQRLLSANDPAVARSMFALGRVLKERGSYDDSIKMFERTVRLQSAQHDASTDLSDSIRELGDAQLYVGHFDTSDSLDKQALEMDRRQYGAIHPRVADDLLNLGEVHHDLGQDGEAEQYYRQALAINQSWYGKEHPATAMTMAAVGQSLVYQKRYEEAAPLLQEAVVTQEHTLGKDNPQVAQGFNILGVLELRRKHYREAEADFRRMADINRASYGDRHLLVAVALMNLGQVYLEEKKYPQAEQFYRDALTRLAEKLPLGHPNTAIAQNQLGHILVLEKRYGEAEPLLLAAHEVMTQSPASQPARLENARKDLVTVYQSLHQPEKAEKYRAKLAAADERKSKVAR